MAAVVGKACALRESLRPYSDDGLSASPNLLGSRSTLHLWSRNDGKLVLFPGGAARAQPVQTKSALPLLPLPHTHSKGSRLLEEADDVANH